MGDIESLNKLKKLPKLRWLQDIKSSVHKNRNLSATLPGNGVRKVLDNPQEQGITVAPLNVEVRYRSTGARRKSYLFPITKVSQVLIEYALNKFKEQGGWFNWWKLNVTKQECKSVPILFNARGQDKGFLLLKQWTWVHLILSLSSTVIIML